MNDYPTLLAAPRFRGYWLALLAYSLGNWSLFATLPILVAERYGAGLVLVASMGLRILPKVLLAPVAGGLLRRFGAARVASAAMLANAALTASLPFAPNIVVLQILVAVSGTVDLFIWPGLASLRAPVTPPGLAMASNTLCSVADRTAKVVGPVLGGLLATTGFIPAFALAATMIATAAIPIARLPAPPPEDAAASAGPRAMLDIVRNDRQVAALWIVALTYMVMLGGLRPFLFWANREWFGNADNAWTLLLAAQGVGSLAGAAISALWFRQLEHYMSAYTLSMLSGILEGAGHLLLLFAATTTQTVLILAAASVPETISTAAWFTAFQERLTPQQQAIFFTYSAPLTDSCFALGIASAALHAQGTVRLGVYWAMVSVISSLPLIPALFVRPKPA